MESRAVDAIEEIRFEELEGRAGSVGLITLNRPQVLNALNHAMFLALNHHLKKWDESDHIKAVIIQAVAGRAFCAGGDIRYAYERGRLNDPALPHFFRDEYRVNQRIHFFSKPYIALLDGITMGGGAGISMHGSHRVITERMTFAMPETGIGLFPDIGATYFLSRLPYKIGFYLGLTGTRIFSQDCLAVGLATQCVSHESLLKIIDLIVDTPLDADAKRSVTLLLKTFEIAPEPSLLMKHKLEIELAFSENTVEGIIKALKHFPSEWCHQTAETILTKSPTSLKVTLKALQKATSLDFESCMKMEYRLVNHFLKGQDFYEGVRAAVIDKDQKPHWNPNQLNLISDEKVNQYFNPIEEELTR